VLVVEVVSVDPEEGTVTARPADPEHGEARPIILAATGYRGPALGAGDRVLARLDDPGARRPVARIIKVLPKLATRIVGVVTKAPHGLRIEPADRRIRTEFTLVPTRGIAAAPGDLVLAEPVPGRGLGLPQARVIERLGDADDPRAFSLAAIHARGIPSVFPDEVLAAAKRLKPARLAEREDLRALPLVTIDGEDARDFDDAVHAAADADPANPGGFVLTVAIADVAWYVRPDDALDREAQKRGNSVYFPDRVVPMLPERLSNDLCSLRPDEDRACLFATIRIDEAGRILQHRFGRGLMRSVARLTYDAVQQAADGNPEALPEPARGGLIGPLYAAYAALLRGRRHRGTLDLDLPELKVTLGEDGHVARIAPRPRHDSHRLIEEFMIAANVAAAETLEARRAPCMYRVHEPPDPERIETLREVLETLGYRLAKGKAFRARDFAKVLEWAEGTPHAPLVNDVVLRTQAMAVYAPENKGHFGLALRRYAHFTSPIRRYADLLVHRALIAALDLGAGGLAKDGAAAWDDLGDRISATERRAAAAERETMDRYLAAFLADRLGATFPGRVSGVTRAGLFVRLDGLGADGLVPMSRLPGDYYRLDATGTHLTGSRSRRRFALGDAVEVRLVEAEPIRGALVFELIGGAEAAPQRGRRHS